MKCEKRHNKDMSYSTDAMTRPVCLICGERYGEHEHYGKSVCPVCLSYIRTNC